MFSLLGSIFYPTKIKILPCSLSLGFFFPSYHTDDDAIYKPHGIMPKKLLHGYVSIGRIGVAL
jgi:hypothetical protein